MQYPFLLQKSTQQVDVFFADDKMEFWAALLAGVIFISIVEASMYNRQACYINPEKDLTAKEVKLVYLCYKLPAISALCLPPLFGILYLLIHEQQEVPSIGKN